MFNIFFKKKLMNVRREVRSEKKKIKGKVGERNKIVHVIFLYIFLFGALSHSFIDFNRTVHASFTRCETYVSHASHIRKGKDGVGLMKGK